nr:transposase [Bradyrhizobium sp. CCBAU 45321]
MRHYSCHSSAETIAKALTGSYRAEHLFALEQALALYDTYHEKASACDARIEAVLKELSNHRGRGHGPAPRASLRRNRTDQANALAFDVREALFALLGKDITTIDGRGPYLSLKLIAECVDDLSSWPSAKHFTSWLGLAPSNKVSAAKGSRPEHPDPAAGRRRFCALLPSPSDAPILRSAPFTVDFHRASARPRP